MRLPRFVAGLASWVWMVAAPAASAAQGVHGHTLDAADLGAWLDGTMAYAMQSGDIAGAVVVVVKDGSVLAGRGYGFADVAAGRPVDAERTLFRPGSISKLFTWTAMMQLVEAGKLDLDRDVNAYLDFRIPRHAGGPITLRELATHTSGFEDILKGLAAEDGEPIPALGAVVKAEIPVRIYRAGEVAAYCNYGAALAGYIVQRVSGEAFDAYVARHIFQPLGMTRSTFAQQPPAVLLADMAKGYRNGSDPPGAFERTGMVPAGALSATGLDIARFMIAHLADGGRGEARILKPQTARLMHATAFQPYAPFPGMALGFYREDRNGRAIAGHAGDTTLFHSDLHLFLDEGVGLYVSMNASGRDGAAGRLRTLLFQAFADRYFPASASPRPQGFPLARAEHDAALAAGSYVSTRRVESGFPRLAALAGEVTVKAGAGGTLVIDPLKTPGRAVKRWREVGPFLWQEVGGTARLMARRDHGRVVAWSDDGPPIAEYRRAAGTYAPINLTLLFCSIAVLAATAALWPVAALVRRRYGARLPLTGRAAMLHRLTRIAAVVAVAAAAGWLVFLSALDDNLSLFNASADPWLRSLQLLLFAAGPCGAVVAATNLVEVWRGRAARGPWARAFSLVLLLAFVDLAWFAFALKLITVSARF